MRKHPSMCHVKELKQNYENILFSIYCDTGKILTNYLNIIFAKQPFDHTFLTFRAGINYLKNCCFLKEELWKMFSIKADVYIPKKRHAHIAFQKSISDYDCFYKIIELISDEWEKRKIFFERYELI